MFHSLLEHRNTSFQLVMARKEGALPSPYPSFVVTERMKPFFSSFVSPCTTSKCSFSWVIIFPTLLLLLSSPLTSITVQQTICVRYNGGLSCSHRYHREQYLERPHYQKDDPQKLRAPSRQKPRLHDLELIVPVHRPYLHHL